MYVHTNYTPSRAVPLHINMNVFFYFFFRDIKELRMLFEVFSINRDFSYAVYVEKNAREIVK